MIRALLIVAALCSGCSPAGEEQGPGPEPPREASSPPSADGSKKQPPTRGDANSITYDAIPDESVLYVVVRRDPEALGSSLSHDHVVHASGWRGTIIHSPDRPELCSVELEIEVAGLVADDPTLRERAELPDGPSSRDRREIEANLRAEGQLDAARHPAIRFASRSVARGGDGLVVRGELSIRGRTREIEVPVEVSVSGDVLMASGRFEATHSDFGFEPYSAMLGALRNDQALEFAFEVRAKAR